MLAQGKVMHHLGAEEGDPVGMGLPAITAAASASATSADASVVPEGDDRDFIQLITPNIVHIVDLTTSDKSPFSAQFVANTAARTETQMFHFELVRTSCGAQT